MYSLPQVAVLVAALSLALTGPVASVGSRSGAAHEHHDATLGLTIRLAQSAERGNAAVLNRAYFVGVWETRNREFGRDVQVFWTVRSDSGLDYDFVIDGVPSRGSAGTWDFRDGVLIENWRRANGSTGSGRASIEKIDDDRFRLTVIDNGDPQYRGLVRTYRRLGPAQTVVRGFGSGPL